MCASAISTGKPKVSKCNCNYKVVIRKSTKKDIAKPWALKKGTKNKDLTHCAMCTSQGKITYRELKQHLKSTNSRILPSIKMTRDRISRDNKIPRSYISNHVAARARLVEAKQCAADYRANWSKLQEWGQELMDLNPGSVFHLEVDERDRFKRMFVGVESATKVASLTGTYKVGR